MPPPVPALQQAFDHWLAHQRVAGRLRRGSSAAVYQAMWQALVAWCQAQQPALRLADLRGQPLLAYLASRHGMLAADGVLTPRYQQRLVSLVQRVQAHQAWRRQQASAGPAQALAWTGTDAPATRRHQPLLQPAATTDSPEPPLHLQPAQAAQLQALLCSAADDSLGRWQQLRDRCAVALQLGAGLGPGDVRGLRLTDVRPGTPSRHATARWQLQVAANGSTPAHAAPLADWAAGVLARWLALRQAQALDGPWLLPSTRSGKPWGKVAQYEAARRVLADAGLDPDGGGSFRLRHSFALHQLQQGHDPALVAGWLGVVDPQVMLRYQRALPPAAAAPTAATADAASGPSPWPV
ncbi:MAG: site-specific integrase [Pseudomonadota bacterium]